MRGLAVRREPGHLGCRTVWLRVHAATATIAGPPRRAAAILRRNLAGATRPASAAWSAARSFANLCPDQRSSWPLGPHPARGGLASGDSEPVSPKDSRPAGRGRPGVSAPHPGRKIYSTNPSQPGLQRADGERHRCRRTSNGLRLRPCASFSAHSCVADGGQRRSISAPAASLFGDNPFWIIRPAGRLAGFAGEEFDSGWLTRAPLTRSSPLPARLSVFRSHGIGVGRSTSISPAKQSMSAASRLLRFSLKIRRVSRGAKLAPSSGDAVMSTCCWCR